MGASQAAFLKRNNESYMKPDDRRQQISPSAPPPRAFTEADAQGVSAASGAAGIACDRGSDYIHCRSSTADTAVF